MNLRNTLKLPYYYFKNRQYNRETVHIMKAVLKPNSNCVDIGCHKGRILDLMLAFAPEGTHYAFEPLPPFFELLKKKYAGTNTIIRPEALSDSAGDVRFKFVKNSPGYSGFRKRTYHVPFPGIEEITVTKTTLDAVIPPGTKIDFIKLDVEGAELEVFRGAERTIRRCRPVIIFEHGTGAAPHYGTKPEDVFDFITGCGLNISTFKNWLHKKPCLDRASFSKQFYKELNYYFIAYP